MAAGLGTKLLSKLKGRRKTKIVSHPHFLKFFPPCLIHFSKIKELLRDLPAESGLCKHPIFRSELKRIRGKILSD